MSEKKLTELFSSNEVMDVLESAIRPLPGGEEAIEAATAVVESS